MTAVQQAASARPAPPPRRCGPAPIICDRSMTGGRCSSMARGSPMSPPTRRFREAARSVARLYDIAAAPEIPRAHDVHLAQDRRRRCCAPIRSPASHADLRARRLFSETWAEATFGLMGRTPDHVAGFFCGYAAVPSVFAAGGQKFADNVVVVLRERCATSTSMSAMRSCRRRSTAASPRTSRATRRSMPAW